RNLPAAKFGWPRVQRSFESRSFAAEAIVHGGLLMAEHPRQQTHNCIDENNRSDCAVRQDVIANGNLKIDEMFDHPVIDSFVMATDDDQMRFLRKLCCQRLVQPSTRWRH